MTDPPGTASTASTARPGDGLLQPGHGTPGGALIDGMAVTPPDEGTGLSRRHTRQRGKVPRRIEEATVTSELVERAQRGDHEAFDALATAAYHRMYAIARRILRDGYAAEDAVQDALVRAWRDLRSLRDADRFDAWLHRLLVNACQDQVRRQRRRPFEVPILAIDQPTLEDRLGQLVDRDELERAFLQLSVEQRAALVLTHYVGLTASEVGAILGIPVGTVYSRLHYGARSMRTALGGPTDAPITNPEPGR